MIFKNRIIQLMVAVFLTGSVLGQDLHFTQFNLAPLTVNPAFTGAFNGSVRLGGIYRDQWKSTYSTPTFYMDSPILKGFRELDWIGVGISIFQDQSTSGYVPFAPSGSVLEGQLTTGGLLGSAAYHLSLDDERNTVLTLGIQGGTLSRKIKGEFRLEDQILNGGASQDIFPTEDDPTTYLDVSGGLTLTGRTTGESFYRVGLSVLHVNQPKNGVLNANRTSLPMRIVGYATYDYNFSDELLIIPSVLYQKIGPASELSVQGMLGYKLPEQDMILKGGLGYRLGDALQVLIGLDYKDLRVGASYDVTVSDLASPSNAFELGVAYIARIYKRPKVDPVIFCPRF